MKTQTAAIPSEADVGAVRARPWLALAALGVAQFMVFLDETVVNVALPSIKVDLGFSQANLAWVVNAYMLTLGGFLLLGGRVADLLGRRRVFLAGIALFGIASLLDGLAQSEGMLIGFRAVQGLGAALATPAALALVTALFSAGAERTKALGIWSGLSGLGFAVGILLGGVLTDLASWRWVFLINVPIALAAMLVLPRLVRESRTEGRRQFDVGGAATVTVGMSLLVYALLNTSNVGWRSPQTYGLIVAALLLLGLFALIERRSETPLVPRGILTRRTTLMPNVVQSFLGAALISTFFLLTLYIQQVLGYTPLQAGLAYLPIAIGVAAATGVGTKLVQPLGPRPLAVGGLGSAACGLVVLAHAPADGSYLADVLPALVLLGIGAGFSFVSINTAALGRVADAVAGLVSGLLTTSVMVGGSLGLAVLASVASTRRDSLLSSGWAPISSQVDGLQLAFWLAAAVAMTGSLVAMFVLRSRVNAGAGGEDRRGLVMSGDALLRAGHRPSHAPTLAPPTRPSRKA